MRRKTEARQLTIRAWRVVNVGQGVMIFCDPMKEHVRLYDGPDPDQDFWHAPMDSTEEELHGWVQGQLFEEDPS